MAQEFSAGIDAWVRATKQRTRAVFQEATKLTVRQAQSGTPHIPVDLGFARASIRASLSDMPQIDRGAVNASHASVPYSEAEVSLVLANFQLGQTIYVGWTAAYAGYLEFGSSQQAPEGFVRIAASMWPTFVSQAVSQLKNRAGAPE